MQIENIKLWQWAIAGIFAGLLFSAILRSVGPAFDTQARDTMEQGEFETRLMTGTKFDQNRVELYTKFHKDLPLLKDVTVHPPLSGDESHMYWVTGREYWIGAKPVDPSKTGGPEQIVEEWKPFKYPAGSTPYKPGYTELSEKKQLKVPFWKTKNMMDMKSAMGNQATFPTVAEYMTAATSIQGSSLKFRYAWWELPKWTWTLPPLAGFLVIGFAWPLAINVMQNFGVAKQPTVKEQRKPAAPAPFKSAPSTAGVVIKPNITPPPPPPSEADKRKYGGEFYPVVKSTEKK